MSEYDYEIIHKSGITYKDADCLSRYPVNIAQKEDEEDAEEIPTFLIDEQNIAEEQLEDANLRKIIDIFENNSPQAPIGLRRIATNFTMLNNTLYKKSSQPYGQQYLLVIPKNSIFKILELHHSDATAGHLGITKTTRKIRDRFYWENLEKDVIKFIKGCPSCQSRKGAETRKPVGLLQPIEVTTPFDKMGIDLLGPFPKSENGHTMIVLAVCYATRYLESACLPNGKAEEVAKFIFDKIILRYGAPREIISDRGKTFQSELVTNLLSLMGTKSKFTTAYHQMANGLTERLNKTFAGMMSHYTAEDQKNWDTATPQITFAYNTATQDTTGVSPFLLVYGREPVLPSEFDLKRPMTKITLEELRQRVLEERALAVQRIQKKQSSDKLRFDEKHYHVEFKKGDIIKSFSPVRKVGRSEKFLPKYFGPYKIVEKMSECNYKILKDKNKTDIIHVSRILPYNEPWTPKPTEEEKEEEDSN